MEFDAIGCPQGPIVAHASRPGGDGVGAARSEPRVPSRISAMTARIDRTDDEWRRDLTPEQYRVARQKGTERPFSGEYNASREPGTYLCAACGAELFIYEKDGTVSIRMRKSSDPLTNRYDGVFWGREV